MKRLKSKRRAATIEQPPTSIASLSNEDSMPVALPQGTPLPGRVVPQVPFVYRDGGYLALTLSTRKGEAHFVSTRAGGVSQTLPFPRFLYEMKPPLTPLDPYRFALNLLARKRTGILTLKARDERRLVTLLQQSPEELAKLSEEHLGVEYARLVGKAPPPETPRKKLIKEILMAVEQSVAVEEKKEAKKEEKEEGKKEENKPAADKAAPNKKKATPSKKKAAPKKKAEPSKKKAAPKKKAEPSKKKAEQSGPFRTGSMKAAAYDFFVKSGGDREKVIAHTVKLGATEATAKSWYSVFCKV